MFTWPFTTAWTLYLLQLSMRWEEIFFPFKFVVVSDLHCIDYVGIYCVRWHDLI